jgi:hypothetical protein
VPGAERRRGPAYLLTWEEARDRRCLCCGRFVGEATTSGMDLRRRLRLCESCVVARLETKRWGVVAALRVAPLSGAA